MSRRGLFRPVLAVLAAVLMIPVGTMALASPVSGAAVGTGASGGGPTVTVSESTKLHPVPSAYLGFSIDPANLCYVVHLARTDPAFVQLFRDVGHGVFRVGGNTGDRRASWSTTATKPTCVWNGLVVTPSLVNRFFAFAQSVGYKVMWQVPLGNGKYAMDAAEAVYVAKMPGLASVEFGNEPDVYPGAKTKYPASIAGWNRIYRDYLADGGTAAVTGPAVFVGDKWYTTPFLNKDAAHLAKLTMHWYVGSAKTSPTCGNLLANPGKSILASAVAQASAAGLPGIINETNTYVHQGMPGVSNAYCSALWAAAYTLNGLAAGLQGMYFHGTADYTPGNSLGRFQYYTPINTDGTPAPEYYGLLFWHEMAQAGGSQVGAHTKSAGNLEAYAVAGSHGELNLALINRSSAAMNITVHTEMAYTKASSISLTAPALNSLSGVTLGGASVAADGTWTPHPQSVTVTGNSSTIKVRADTGVIVTYSS